MKTESVSLWMAVNKNGRMNMFLTNPIRRENKWEGHIFINSIIYKQLLDLCKQADFNWNNEPEFFEITLQ